MIRFIIKNSYRLDSGMEDDVFRTIDINVPELEHVLSSGGFGQDSYDMYKLVGVEIIEEQKKAMDDETDQNSKGGNGDE